MLSPRDAGITGRGYELFVTSIVMVVLAAVFVCTRLAYRKVTHTLGWDDYTIAVSVTLSVALTTAMCMAITDGYGQHRLDLTTQQVRDALKWYYVAQCIYKPIIGLTKSSILVSYLRIFTISRSIRNICWVTMAVIISWTVATTVATILQCIPLQASWNKTIKGKCTNSDVFWLAYGGVNIATDVIILLIPIKPIMGLKMRSREKIGLLIAFLLGGFVVVTSIFRVIAVRASTANKADITWAFVPRATWTLIEVNIAIVCSCLPALRKPLLALVSSHRLFSTSSESQQDLTGRTSLEHGFKLHNVMGSNKGRGGKLDKPITVTQEYHVSEEQSIPSLPGRDSFQQGVIS